MLIKVLDSIESGWIAVGRPLVVLQADYESPCTDIFCDLSSSQF